MKIKFILVVLILISGIVFVQADIALSEVKSADKFENYSSNIQKALNKEPVDWTIKEVCIFIKGCWDFKEKICYPFGYVKGKTYCSDTLTDNYGKRTYGFVEQKGWGNLCEQNFECEGNLCYEGKCIRTIESELIESLIKKINELEEKLNFQEEERNPESKSLITGGVVSEISQERKGFFNWIKGKFGFD